MQRLAMFLAVTAVVVAISEHAVSQPENEKPPQPEGAAAPAGLLDVLEPGQVVGMERTGDAYRVTVNPRWRLRDVYTLVAVSREGLILETQNRDMELRVPVHSILEVVISKTGVRR